MGGGDRAGGLGVFGKGVCKGVCSGGWQRGPLFLVLGTSALKEMEDWILAAAGSNPDSGVGPPLVTGFPSETRGCEHLKSFCQVS